MALLLIIVINNLTKKKLNYQFPFLITFFLLITLYQNRYRKRIIGQSCSKKLLNPAICKY